MKDLSDKKFLKRVIIVALATLIVIYFREVLNGLKNIWEIIIPFIIGMSIAYIWNLIMRFIENKIFGKIKSEKFKKIKRPLSILVSLLFILFTFVMILYLIIPQIYSSISLIIDNVPKLVNNLYNWLRAHSDNEFVDKFIIQKLIYIQQNWGQHSAQILRFVQQNMGGVLGSTVGVINSVFEIMATAFISFVFSIYLLSGKETLGKECNAVIYTYIPKNIATKIKYVLKVMDDKFSSFFRGQILDAFFVGIMLYVTLLIVGIPYALTIAVVIMVTALIPMLGAYIGGLLGFIMVAAQNLNQGFIFLLILIIIQQIDDNFVYPKLVGDSVGLAGVWTFSAVILGGLIAGSIGMIVFVPLAASIYTIIEEDIKNKKKNQKLEIKEGNKIL